MGDSNQDGEDDPGDEVTARADRRLFGDRRRERRLFVAAPAGIAGVDVADGRVGQFSLLDRRSCSTVAAGEECVIAGTDEGVLVDTGQGFQRLHGEPDRAIQGVGIHDDALFWATSAGEVFRLVVDDWPVSDTETVTDVGTVTEPVAIEAGFLGTATGIYRLNDRLATVAETESLGTLQDLSLVGEPSDRPPADALLVATSTGIYRRASGGWIQEHGQASSVIQTAGDHAVAANDDGVLVRTDSGWHRPAAQPNEPIVDLAIDDRPYALSASGTVWTTTEPFDELRDRWDWRSFAIGLVDATECALAPPGAGMDPQ